MKKLIVIFLLICSCTIISEQDPRNFVTTFETSEGLETAEYHEVIDYYTRLADAFPELEVDTMGVTDSGIPLHLFTYNPERIFEFDKIRKNQRILLINNGIHPGESDGIDATMMLIRDLLTEKLPTPQHTVISVIPVYNIGGSLNRNSGTRANQNGPKSYGFRGNARNFDLNRDFIKSDTKNARSFAEIYHMVKPDLFIDNHVSNGADYQYVLTHLFTQHNKLGGELGRFLHETLQPELEAELAEKNWDITPYVNVFNRTPETGFSQFFDHPRYSTGYTTLFNSLGMMVETHMLKPYKDRVTGTYELMRSMLSLSEKHHAKIAELRTKAALEYQMKSSYPIQWTIDTTKSSILNFKGYEADRIPSVITGAQRLKYDRSRPFTKEVTYQNYFKPSKEVKIPEAYIIPQGWHKIIDLLKLNGINMNPLSKDSSMTVESYRIKEFETRREAYEGHYLHYRTKVSASTKEINFKVGDFIVPTNQPGIRYIIETLEPEANDSFFNWNFFDTILQQKEGFSPYVFEETALKLLQENPELKQEFEQKKAEEPDFNEQWYYQLYWIYERSHHYEAAHMQYPIYRKMKS